MKNYIYILTIEYFADGETIHKRNVGCYGTAKKAIEDMTKIAEGYKVANYETIITNKVLIAYDENTGMGIEMKIEMKEVE